MGSHLQGCQSEINPTSISQCKWLRRLRFTPRGFSGIERGNVFPCSRYLETSLDVFEGPCRNSCKSGWPAPGHPFAVFSDRKGKILSTINRVRRYQKLTPLCSPDLTS